MTTLILRGETGSRAYGTNTPDSDTDLAEVVLEPREAITGLGRFDTKVDNTAAQGTRSMASDTDKTIYGLQKFADLAVTGNPSVLSLLFLGSYDHISEYGQRLLDARSSFVSKSAGRRHLGYMTSQRAAMTGARNQRTNRPELIHKFGYDTKFAYHMIRLGMLGLELMNTGTMQLPMREAEVGVLMHIREGKVSKEDVLSLSFSQEADLETAIENADLPDKGDRQLVSDILHGIYMEEWSK